MVEHGRQRATEFSSQRILDHWASLLFDELPRLMREPAAQRWHRVPLLARRWTGRLRRMLSPARER
jgi:hypothetical protein